MYVQVYMYAMCVPGACEGWESMLEPLELELQVATNHHVVLATKSRSFGRGAITFNHRAISPVLEITILLLFLQDLFFIPFKTMKI